MIRLFEGIIRMPNLKNQQKVESLFKKFKSMNGLILTEYHGLKVNEISELRSKLRQFSCDYIIVKNTLSKIAFRMLNNDIKIDEKFSGPIAIVIENGVDISLPAKVLVEFSKTYTNLKIKSGLLNNKLVDSSFIIKLSSLPSKGVLMSMLICTLNVPVVKFINVLIANIINLTLVLHAVARSKKT
ncbi:MAG: 50S ribosomal protein L10 [Endomicrobium sp.]|nr:50S ribosomal protein L10 [Endomicrobium sp.]